MSTKKNPPSAPKIEEQGNLENTNTPKFIAIKIENFNDAISFLGRSLGQGEVSQLFFAKLGELKGIAELK